MKIAVIGDIHGRSFWKRAISNSEPFDKLIFIGDYFDSFDIGPELQMENFKDICAYRESQLPGKVIMLIGNHDFHYMKEAAGETYSGFNHSYKSSIGYLLGNEKENMHMAYYEAPYLFTHAGVTKTWCEENAIVPSNTVADQINTLWKCDGFVFSFTGLDDTGDDVTQGPLWVRPRSLHKNAIEGFVQVVGHTQVKEINSSPNTGMWLIDSVQNNQYLEIIDGKVKIITLLKLHKRPKVGYN